MKLVFAIVQKEDTKPLIRALIEHEISVTRISSVGGFSQRREYDADDRRRGGPAANRAGRDP